jgi:hypothetical protein
MPNLISLEGEDRTALKNEIAQIYKERPELMGFLPVAFVAAAAARRLAKRIGKRGLKAGVKGIQYLRERRQRRRQSRRMSGEWKL